MLVRACLIGFFCLSIGLFVYLNPVPQPEKNKQARFIKISEGGQPMAAWAGPWDCVWDTKTRLLWEVKSYREDIHDHQCSFSWFNQSRGTQKGGAEKRGDCFIEGQASDTSDLVQAANKMRYCGSMDWRLPSEEELKTLIYKDPKPGEPLIPRDYFPFAKNAPYWTANGNQKLEGHFQYLKEGAMSINFATGESQSMPYDSATFVRLVTSSVSSD